MLNGKSILITGGSGSFGKLFVKKILWDYPDVKKIVIYSRDELRQFEMQNIFPKSKYHVMRYYIGDIRDYERLKKACEGIDVVIHAAAMTRVDISEFNPEECIKTNILGAQNLIDACMSQNVHDVLMLSSDKACSPINLYGASKLTAERLFIAANNMKGSRDLRFSVVRYGNVMGSEGTVIPYFLKLKKEGSGIVPVTNLDMTRFNITQQESVNLVLWALEHHMGGEIIIPKVPSYRITDLVKAILPDASIEIIGLRQGEKLNEEIITVYEAPNTIDRENYYVIIPTHSAMYSREKYIAHHGKKFVSDGFSYSSNLNDKWETVETLREKINKYLKPHF